MPTLTYRNDESRARLAGQVASAALSTLAAQLYGVTVVELQPCGQNGVAGLSAADGCQYVDDDQKKHRGGRAANAAREERSQPLRLGRAGAAASGADHSPLVDRQLTVEAVAHPETLPAQVYAWPRRVQ